MTLISWGSRCLGWMFVLLCASPWLVAQQSQGAVIYRTQCAICHENSTRTRAPGLAPMRLMSPENILLSRESGRMKEQGSLLSPEQRRTVAEFLAGKPFGQEKQLTQQNLCPKTPFAPSSTDWNGWG